VERLSLAHLDPGLARRADVILLDLTLPGVAGLASVDTVKALAPDVPLIVLTGPDERGLGNSALRRGAHDHLVVSEAGGLSLDRAIRYCLETVRLERLIDHQARHDPLTDLPNRASLQDRLSRAGDRAERLGDRSAVLMVDLDHFHRVNDVLGHAAGDQLLVAVASRMRSLLRPADFLARLGGDEFVVLCAGIQGFEAAQVQQLLSGAFTEPFLVAGRGLRVAISVGVAELGPGTDPSIALRDAATALNAAKQQGGGCAVWFDPELRRQAESRFRLEHDLREELRTGRRGLRAAYQPIMDTETQTPVGFEALARWNHPELGEVPPAQFVLVAESSGLALDLDLLVIDRALAELRRRSDGDQVVVANCNVSGRSVQAPEFEAELTGAVRRHGVRPDRVTLEVLETATLGPGAAGSLDRLRGLGFRVALDDFGAGSSSLTHFLSLSADMLKLDRTFVAAAATGDSRAVTLLELIVTAAGRLGLEVVAEGVETAEHLGTCRRLGVPMAQGFLWGRPV
jgi:diguanylate cyclase (GGDEF)-like protein